VGYRQCHQPSRKLCEDYQLISTYVGLLKKNETEPKRNRTKQIETKRNTTKQNRAKQIETKQYKFTRNEIKQ